MRKLYLHSLLLLGIAMVVIGVWCLFNPTTSLRVLTLTIGIILILNGINNVSSYFQWKKIWRPSRWILIDGIFSFIIGGLIFMYTNTAERVFIIIFAAWLLVSSILYSLIAFAVRGLHGWIVLLMLGIITGLLAIVSFFTNVIAAISVAIMLGLFFIAQGFIWISFWRLVNKRV